MVRIRDRWLSPRGPPLCNVVLVSNLVAERQMMAYIPLNGTQIRTEEVWICLNETRKMTTKRSLEKVLLIRLEGPIQKGFNVLPSPVTAYSNDDSAKMGKGNRGAEEGWNSDVIARDG